MDRLVLGIGGLAVLSTLLGGACGGDEADAPSGAGTGTGETATTGGTCDDLDRPCEVYTDCCPGHDCSLGTCLAVACDPMASCGSTTACCGGQACIAGACRDTCGQVGETCTTNYDCCDGDCHDDVCSVPTKNMGDPCTGNFECISGDCNDSFGWCTAECASNAECGGMPNELGHPVVCSGASDKCSPTCDSDADCTQFDKLECVPDFEDAHGNLVGFCIGGF